MLFVYALHHDTSREIYIGRASNKQRPYEHLKIALRGSDDSPHSVPVHRWIRFLHNRGLKYEVTVLEICDSQKELNEAEVFFIDLFRSVGAPVLNHAPGGGGGGTGTPLSVDLLKRVRAIIDTEGIELFEEHTSCATVMRAACGARLRQGTIELIEYAVSQIERQIYSLKKKQ